MQYRVVAPRDGFTSILIKGTPNSDQSFVIDHLTLEEGERKIGHIVLKDVVSEDLEASKMIRKFLSKNHSRLEKCYADILWYNPDIKGELSFSIQDQENNYLLDFNTTTKERNQLNRCISVRINKMKRPKISSEVRVYYKLEQQIEKK